VHRPLLVERWIRRARARAENGRRPRHRAINVQSVGEPNGRERTCERRTSGFAKSRREPRTSSISGTEGVKDPSLFGWNWVRGAPTPALAVLHCIEAPLTIGSEILRTKTTPTLNRLYKQAQSSPSEFSHGREWQCSKLRPSTGADDEQAAGLLCAADPAQSSRLHSVPHNRCDYGFGRAAVAVVAMVAALRPRCASATPSAETSMRSHRLALLTVVCFAIEPATSAVGDVFLGNFFFPIPHCW